MGGFGLRNNALRAVLNGVNDLAWFKWLNFLNLLLFIITTSVVRILLCNITWNLCGIVYHHLTLSTKYQVDLMVVRVIMMVMMDLVMLLNTKMKINVMMMGMISEDLVLMLVVNVMMNIMIRMIMVDLVATGCPQINLCTLSLIVLCTWKKTPETE